MSVYATIRLTMRAYVSLSDDKIAVAPNTNKLKAKE